MKSIYSFAFLALAMTLVIPQAHAETLILKCKNVAASPVTATLEFGPGRAHLQFGKGSSGNALENDVKEKSLELTLTPQASRNAYSSNGYSSFIGEVLVDARYKEWRQVQVSLNFQSVNARAIQVLFQISEPYVAALGPATVTHYGMVCSR